MGAKREAGKALTLLLAEVAKRDEAVTRTKITVGQFLDRWLPHLEVIAKAGRGQSTNTAARSTEPSGPLWAMSVWTSSMPTLWTPGISADSATASPHQWCACTTRFIRPRADRPSRRSGAKVFDGGAPLTSGPECSRTVTAAAPAARPLPRSSLRCHLVLPWIGPTAPSRS